MPKYLIQGSYSEQGLKGILQEGGRNAARLPSNQSKEWVGDWKPTTMPLGATIL
jgi:hypothetical protein